MQTNIWLMVLFVMFSLTFVAIAAIRRCGFPSVDTLIKLAPLFNSKGGLILLLTVMWFFSMIVTISVVIWVVAGKVDPQNTVVVMLLGMLTSGAFGGVSSVLFRTMTGEDPPAPNTSSETTIKKSSASV